MWINIPEFADLKVENTGVETNREHCEKADIHISRVLGSHDKGVEEIFEEIMPENFLKLTKDSRPHIQEVLIPQEQ